jgi:outer membrane protein OmpA-like peptidoglycan-associated protein
MLTLFTAKRALFILCLMTMPALTGCYTTAGFGRDVQQMGQWIEGSANNLAAGLYGPEAEEPSAQAAATKDTGTSPEQSVVPAAGNNVVYFSTGSAEIPSDGLEMIRSIAEDAQPEQQAQQATQDQEGTARIEVVGYTDSAGPASFNEELSQRRAEAVADALAAEGLSREAITVRWHGEEQLPVPTADDVHEPDNRRVSISMMGT